MKRKDRSRSWDLVPLESMDGSIRKKRRENSSDMKNRLR